MNKWAYRRKGDLIAGCTCPKNPDGSMKRVCEVVEIKAGFLFVHPLGEGEHCRTRVSLGTRWICRDRARKELYRRYAV
ncbi:MAG: hypothetical protein ACM3Y9_12775 [Ignavibacteria bacterium]